MLGQATCAEGSTPSPVVSELPLASAMAVPPDRFCRREPLIGSWPLKEAVPLATRVPAPAVDVVRPDPLPELETPVDPPPPPEPASAS